ncbi:hypothetical protein [Chitinophaga nivalis]|uniref:DUF4304 domain-containing protein n=1 Tax=Chitinophaga nivalis TaxID=2991709 RepID=A0ABT3IJE8_9BACT|nr:hypothetical protein [Chitinophaga nivalis]MCW3466430.1 hypothetical protein [Chitinophaga nivalis]MCW3483879.1 hypothetical protein [Chitinophaga nivalis]
MTQKKVLRDLIELLQPKLSPFNFKPNLKEQGFFRKDEHATYFYFFNIYNRTVIQTGEKGYLIEPNAKIGIQAIERYYKEITVNSYLTSEWNFTTLGNNIANLLANPDGINRQRNKSLDLLIFTETDLYEVATEIYNKFTNVAMPYFLMNNTISRVDELLNSYPKEYSVHLVNDLWRFIKGLIAAKLNNNPKLHQLIETYSNLLIERDMDPDCFQEMENLKKNLSKITS